VTAVQQLVKMVNPLVGNHGILFLYWCNVTDWFVLLLCTTLAGKFCEDRISEFCDEEGTEYCINYSQCVG
jgi:hypothetical protein